MLCGTARPTTRRLRVAVCAAALSVSSLVGAEPVRVVAGVAPIAGGDYYDYDRRYYYSDPSHAYDKMSRLVVVGNRLVFQATDGGAGYQIWATDGTTEGTVLLHPGDPDSSIQSAGLTLLGRVAIFSVWGASGLWKTDGTPEGTTLLKKVSVFTLPFNVGDVAGSPYHTFVTVGGLAFFVGWGQTSGLQLWRTDGTPEGTFPVKGGFFDYSLPFFPDGPRGRLLFQASKADSVGLFSSDGTARGTKLVKIGVEMSSPVLAAGKILFEGRTPADGKSEIWVSDSTPGGTRRLTSFSGNRDVYYANGLASSGPVAFFRVVTTNGPELWASDGTEAGTRVILSGGALGDDPIGNWAALEGRLFFVSRAGSRHHLWRSDGTPVGTGVVKDLGDVEVVTGLQAAAGRLFFARRTSPDSEVWTSDGTESGTRRVTSFSHAGHPRYLPGGMTRLGPWVLFGAHEDGRPDSPGGELWAMPAPVDVSVLDARAPRIGCGATADFRVRLSGPSEEPITIEYATADGSAQAGRDYETTQGTLTFAPGSTSGLVQVPLRCNPEAERARRAFYLDLSNPTNASITRSRATARLDRGGDGIAASGQ